MRRIWLAAVAVSMALIAAGVLVVAGPAASALGTGSCRVTWGSQPKGGLGGGDPLVGVRAGRHGCYDRLVFDFRGSGGVRDVRYGPVLTQGQGRQLQLAGGATLNVTLSSPANDVETGAPTFRPGNPDQLVNVSGFRTFRQVAYGGSFEGVTTVGLGVRAQLPFRVFILSGPGTSNRVVIDVAHHW